MENELKNATTLNEILAICNKYYNLDSKLGIVGKPMAIANIPKIIKMLNIPKR